MNMLFPNWTRLMSRRIRRSRRPLGVAAAELLERRIVPAVNLTGSSTVTIVISSGEDVTVSQDDADANADGFVALQLVIDGDTRIYDGETLSDEPTPTVYPFIDANFVESLTIKATASGLSGTNGDNVIDLGDMSEAAYVLLSSLTVKAGGGNDVITGSPLTTLNEVIFGGRGDDSIDGGNGSDVLNGEDGNDTITGGAGGVDDGDDTILGGAGTDVLTGGDGNDNIKGQIGNDSIVAGAGDDRIDGSDGNDTLNGGDGNDSILAGNGNDVVFGDDTDGAVAPGNDTIDGGAGFDLIRGEEGDDSINGGDGNDIIGGGTGDDTLNGGNGNDKVFGDAGNDVISGGAGNDTLLGGDDNDSLVGGAGNDIMAGQDGIDTVNGQGGSDTVAGGSGGAGGTADPGDFVIGAPAEQKEESTLVTGPNIGWTNLVRDVT
ncbi:MAG: hypothetical protein IAG10_32380 [Planctomycetaceae bacterium]|nr:hypothetical protein [Planctomycetaceae bacterium]